MLLIDISTGTGIHKIPTPFGILLLIVAVTHRDWSWCDFSILHTPSQIISFSGNLPRSVPESRVHHRKYRNSSSPSPASWTGLFKRTTISGWMIP